jgi:5'(3')-deoxyribonucleotidase
MPAPMAATRFVLGVDLDGVVADFYAAIRIVASEWLGVPIAQLTDQPKYGLKEWGIPDEEAYHDLHRFAVTQRNLFEKLQPIDGAPPALRRLSDLGIRIRIITHRLYIKYFHEEAVRQTTRWLEHHGIPYWDLCFMRDKAAVGADLYIEDSPKNVEQLRADGHPTIVYTNSTNLEIAPPRADNWRSAENLILEALKEFEKKSAGHQLEGQ